MSPLKGFRVKLSDLYAYIVARFRVNTSEACAYLVPRFRINFSDVVNSNFHVRHPMSVLRNRVISTYIK